MLVPPPLRFERLPGNDLPLPQYATDGSAAFDLAACLRRPVIVPSEDKNTDRRVYSGLSSIHRWKNCDEDAVFSLDALPALGIPGGFRVMISTGWKLQFPPGYVMHLYPRSSCVKTGLQLANSVGVIDSDYRGELFVVLFNTNPRDGLDYLRRVAHGERIAQATVVPVMRPIISEGQVDQTARGAGGFGSTGMAAAVFPTPHAT